jgi:MraZ protein
MLRGRFEHTLDSKGRMSIPSRFREHIVQRYSETLVLTNFDRCLVAFPLEEWEQLERKAANLPQLKKEVKAFQRFFLAGATECPIDKQGRILIPPTLREYAGLGRDAVLVGLLKKFEIWSKERWHQEFAKSQKGFESFSDVLGDLGI